MLLILLSWPAFMSGDSFYATESHSPPGQVELKMMIRSFVYSPYNDTQTEYLEVALESVSLGVGNVVL